MKRQTLDILHRYRKHLLEQEQMLIVQRLTEENTQKVRLLQLQQRVAQTHEAKLRATSSADLVAIDEAATYLHSRVTMAQRALALARSAREEAVARTLELKKERDQVGLLLERDRCERLHAQDESERNQLNELATARYAMAAGGL
jgi:signal-transduction protein with cAMP-binding, CBS, and nucleotidyltransferase domain